MTTVRVLTFFAVLSCTCFTTVLTSPQCSSLGPADCYFGSNFDEPSSCGWNITSGWGFYWSDFNRNYLGLKSKHNATERVESREACSTGNAVHCLKFSYYVEQGNGVSLSVLVKTTTPGGAVVERELWKMSGPQNWRDGAQVPLNVSTEFSVVFEARSPEQHMVFLDFIDYRQESCEIQPPEAVPTTTTTSQPTTASMTTASQPTTMMSTTTITNAATTITTATTTTTTAATTTSKDGGTSSSAAEEAYVADGGVIVGVVVVGVVCGSLLEL